MKLMSYLIGACLILVLSGCTSLETHQANYRELYEIEQQFLNTDFEIVTNKELIDSRVFSHLKNNLANPQMPYNAGCEVNFSNPSSQLIFAGNSKELSFVYYISGGFVVSRTLIISHIKNDELIRECRYRVGLYKDIQDLKNKFPNVAQKSDSRCFK